MRGILKNAVDLYGEIWQDIHWLGYPWLIIATIIPLVPVICLMYGIMIHLDTTHSNA